MAYVPDTPILDPYLTGFNETEKGLLFSHNYKSLIFFAISILVGIILSAYVIQTYKKNCAKVQLYSEKSKCMSLTEVRENIEVMIDEAMNSTDPEVRANFKKYFGNKRPTPEEYIYIITKKTRV